MSQEEKFQSIKDRGIQLILTFKMSKAPHWVAPIANRLSVYKWDPVICQYRTFTGGKNHSQRHFVGLKGVSSGHLDDFWMTLHFWLIWGRGFLCKYWYWRKMWTDLRNNSRGISFMRPSLMAKVIAHVSDEMSNRPTQLSLKHHGILKWILDS